MSEYPFNLRGPNGSYRGGVRTHGETQKSPEFTLRPGILVAQIKHYGDGQFKLEFVPAEGVGKNTATAAGLGGSFAAGAATGAAIGSIIPVAGTIIGGLLGAGAGLFANKVIQDAIGPTIWTALDGEGRIATYGMVQVKEDTDGALAPGKYRLEVNSQSNWECKFIQPDLGQSEGSSMVTEEEEGEEGPGDLVEAGLYVWGPLRSGRRPVLAEVQHLGGGTFSACAMSVDGTHRCLLHEQEGQFHLGDIQTEIMPGKEYMVLVASDGSWDLEFTEGY